MRKTISLILLGLVCSVGTIVQADDDPTFEKDNFNSLGFSNVIKAFDDVTLIAMANGTAMTSFSNSCIQLGNGATGYNMYCFGIQSDKVITKVSFHVTSNSSGNTIKPAVVGWTGSASSNANYVTDGLSRKIEGGSSYSNAVWIDYDLSGQNLKEVRLYRNISSGFTLDEADMGTKGSNVTIRLYGVRVWLDDGDTREELSLSFNATNGILSTIVSGTISTNLSWTEDTSLEEEKYSISYTSNATDVATVNSDGVITGVAVGSATITATVTAAADATYKTSKAKLVINIVNALSKNANFLTPEHTLDLSNAETASTMINHSWTPDRPYFGNNGVDNYLTFTVNSAFSSKANETWIEVPNNGDNPGGSTTGESWDATGVFKGSDSYSTNSAATGQSGRVYTFYSFRIKGVSKVQLLVKGSAASAATLAAFEITDGTVASTTTIYHKCEDKTVRTLTVNLDIAKEYLITICNDLNGSNSRFYEMALYYDESVTLTEAITPAYAKTTYVTRGAMDFSAVSPSGLKAYVATAAAAGSVTLTQVTTVPSGTPLLLTGTAGTKYSIPYIESAPAPASNLLEAGDGTTVFDGSTYDYILYSDGLFYQIGSGTVASTKAYLHCDSDPTAGGSNNAPGLRIVLAENNATNIEAIEAKEYVVKFFENGQMYIKRDNVVYDALGRKIR